MNDTYKKAKMFNKKASKKKSKADQIINKLEIKKGNKIADIGSGGGYFTIKFAKIVENEGHIYAIDTNRQFLDYIELQAKKNDLKNITTVHIKSDIPKIPNEKLDYLYLRNVYHHIPDRIKYIQSIGGGLKKNGKIIIIEHNGKGIFNFNKIFGHYIEPEIIKKEMIKAGFKIKKEYDFINHQSFTIFTKTFD